MPKFRARSIDVRLSVAELDKTITPSPLNTLCQESTFNAHRAIKQFEADAKDGTLPETSLWSDEDGCSLGYLGEHQSMPFFMVHAKPLYPFKRPTARASKGRKKPPPLQLPAVNDDDFDSPLTDFTDSPLTPISILGSVRSRDGHNHGGKQAQARPRKSSIHQLQGGESAEGDPRPSNLRQPEYTLAAGLNSARDSTTNSANRSHLAGEKSGHDYSLGGHSSKTQQPQALCLRVLPAAKSFLKTCDPSAAWTYNDIKIDVYLNGDLCASSYVPEKVHHIKPQDTFSGARDGRLTEKPWVLMPPKADTIDDSVHLSEPEQIEDRARRRWMVISDALIIAALSHGQSPRKEIPIISQYLQSVAAIPMPATLPSILKTNHKRFSIIDVLVTSGKGNKDPVHGSYLLRPLSLKLYGFKVKEESPIPGEQEGSEKHESSTVVEQEDPKKQQLVTGDPSTRRRKSSADQQIPMQSSFPHSVPRSSAGESESGHNPVNRNDTEPAEERSIHQAARKRSMPTPSTSGLSHTSFTSETPATEQSPVSGPPISTSKHLPRVRKAPQKSQENQSYGRRSRVKSNPVAGTVTPLPIKQEEQKSFQASTIPATSKDVPRPMKKRRIRYHDVIDAKQTQAEEIEDIARQAADKDAIFFIERRITRSKIANTTDDIETDINAAPREALSKPLDPEPKVSNPKPAASALASLPRRKKPQDTKGVTVSQGPNTAQHHRAAAEPIALSHRQRDRSLAPLPKDGAESSSPEKPLILGRRKRSSTSLRSVPSMTPHPTAHNCDPSTNQPAKPSSSRNKSSINTDEPAPKPPAAAWETPPLSKDSIVTYAEEGVERQIRAERGGWFREEELLVGVRFVIG